MFKVVVAGCGAMSRGWLKAIAETPFLRDRIEIVGLVDLAPEQADVLSKEFNLSRARVGTDLDDVLLQTGPDVVFDIVVPSARRKVVETAMHHGCHVLSEKPMALSMHDALDLIALSKRCERVHAIVQNRRYVDGVQRVRRFIASGALGALTGIHCDFFLAPHFGGFREVMDHVLLLDMSIHTFDAARYMSGKEPRVVFCHETNPTGSWFRHGASANAIFELSDGVVFNYRGSWCADGFRTSWEAAWRFVGTSGTLLWDGADRLVAEIIQSRAGFFSETSQVPVPQLEPGALISGHAGVIVDFLDSIEQGTAPPTASTDNISSLAMVFGAIESANHQRRVAITDLESSQ